MSPAIFGINDVWAAIVVAELMAVIIGAVFIVTKRKKYDIFNVKNKIKRTAISTILLFLFLFFSLIKGFTDSLLSF